MVSACLAQVEVKSGTYYQLDGLGKITQVGDLTLVAAPPSIVIKPVGIIRVETEAANVEVSISDSQRTPYEAKQLDSKTWVINTPGRWWIDVTAIDFTKNIYGRKQSVVVVGGSGPGPEPPGPGPTPPPPTPSPVPNDYGIGQIAYSLAPRDTASAAKYAAIYKQAGDFLYGVPSLKAVSSSNLAHAADPNRNVLAWIKQQYSLVQCTDQAVCQQWEAWKLNVTKAFTVSQQKRQFTNQDWYNAFNEVARALAEVR